MRNFPVWTYLGHGMTTPLEKRIAEQNAEIERLRGALEAITTWCEGALEENKNGDCSDPWAECPMQDACKDYSLAGHVRGARAPLPVSDKEEIS